MIRSPIKNPNVSGKGTGSSKNPTSQTPVAQRRTHSTKKQLRKDRRRPIGETNLQAKPSTYPSSRQHRRKGVARQHSSPTPSVPTVEPRHQKDSSPNITLERIFLLSGFLTGTALIVMSALDLIVNIPFYGASVLFDIGFLISGAILLYLSWDARR